MQKDSKISFITLWRLNDWGMYNRRDEAILWELSRRDIVEKVLHIEHIGIRVLMYRTIQWIKEKDALLREVYKFHIKKGMSLKPISIDKEKKYYVYSVVSLYQGNNPLLKKISNHFLNIQYFTINKYFSKAGENVVLIAYPPSKYLSNAIETIRHDILIADFEDDTAERSNDEASKKRILHNYKKILPQCKWIFSTSPSINQKYKDYAQQEITFLPNGTDIKNVPANSYKKLFKKFNKKAVGYIGILNREIDFDLFEYILSQYPQVDFVLIGIASHDQLIEINKLAKQYNNLRYLGARNYRDIPGYLTAFDVLINIKKNDHTTAGANLQKIYDYLSSGKPIVTTPIPPADRFADFMYVASDKFQFSEFLKIALEEDNKELREKRIKIALDNSWDKRVDVILERAKALLADNY